MGSSSYDTHSEKPPVLFNLFSREFLKTFLFNLRKEDIWCGLIIRHQFLGFYKVISVQIFLKRYRAFNMCLLVLQKKHWFIRLYTKSALFCLFYTPCNHLVSICTFDNRSTVGCLSQAHFWHLFCDKRTMDFQDNWVFGTNFSSF